MAAAEEVHLRIPYGVTCFFLTRDLGNVATKFQMTDSPESWPKRGSDISSRILRRQILSDSGVGPDAVGGIVRLQAFDLPSVVIDGLFYDDDGFFYRNKLRKWNAEYKIVYGMYTFPLAHYAISAIRQYDCD